MSTHCTHVMEVCSSGPVFCSRDAAAQLLKILHTSASLALCLQTPAETEYLLYGLRGQKQHLAGDVVTDREAGPWWHHKGPKFDGFFCPFKYFHFFFFTFLAFSVPVVVSCQSQIFTSVQVDQKQLWNLLYIKTHSYCQVDFWMDDMHLRSGQLWLSHMTVDNSQWQTTSNSSACGWEWSRSVCRISRWDPEENIRTRTHAHKLFSYCQWTTWP